MGSEVLRGGVEGEGVSSKRLPQKEKETVSQLDSTAKSVCVSAEGGGGWGNKRVRKVNRYRKKDWGFGYERREAIRCFVCQVEIALCLFCKGLINLREDIGGPYNCQIVAAH